MRPSTVVVPNVFHEHYPHVLLVEDQYAVGESAWRVRANRSAKRFARGYPGQSKIGSAFGPG